MCSLQICHCLFFMPQWQQLFMCFPSSMCATFCAAHKESVLPFSICLQNYNNTHHSSKIRRHRNLLERKYLRGRAFYLQSREGTVWSHRVCVCVFEQYQCFWFCLLWRADAWWPSRDGCVLLTSTKSSGLLAQTHKQRSCRGDDACHASLYRTLTRAITHW